MTEEEFADVLGQVAGVPYEVEALPRKQGLAARGLALADLLDEDLGLDAERRTELVVALEEHNGDALDEADRAALTGAATVGELWAVVGRLP